jgi:hypothetical protein
MPIVTLTTDFGTRDPYIGALKGAMLSMNPQLNIVDISHDVPAFDIVRAAFILKNCWDEFPAGTIHVVSVNPFVNSTPAFIAVNFNKHIFILPDNGLLSLLFPLPFENAFRIPLNPASTFPQKSAIAKSVAAIAGGKPVFEIGEQVKEPESRLTLQPVVNAELIRGTVIHKDAYGNVITNITHDLFHNTRNNRPFSIVFKNHRPIFKISQNYTHVPVGETLALFNDLGLLEIAMNMDDAASLLDMQIDDTVQINFQAATN